MFVLLFIPSTICFFYTLYLSVIRLPKYWTSTLYGCLFWLISGINCFSQTPSDPIRWDHINEKYLEHLIKVKIDAVRTGLQLKPLCNDSILYVSAKYHSTYLYQTGTLTHDEKGSPLTETPQKRARYFGAVNYLVGENIALTYLNMPLKNKQGALYSISTYQQAADEFVQMWIHSPGHYKNMVLPEYNATGLAICVDKKTNIIYAVQNFATILYKYSFEENRTFFPYSNTEYPKPVSSFDGIDTNMHKGKHVFGLKKAKKTAPCARCNENDSNFTFGLTRIEHQGNGIFLVSYSYEAIANLLKKRKDGFAAELVNYTPYDCGNPEYFTKQSRRNKECLFSGIVLKPIYRKKALSGFRPSAKRLKAIKKSIKAGKITKYSLKLGKVPKTIKDYYEVNLIILQKKKVCKVMHFSSFCGDTLDHFYKLPYYLDSISNTKVLSSASKNIKLTIPFEKNVSDYPVNKNQLPDTLLKGLFLADSMEIQAYSSIEGEERINKILEEQRALHISEALSIQQNKKIHTKITSGENWDLFGKQIKKNSELKKYEGLSKDSVKSILKNESEKSKLDPFLNEQRVAHVSIHAHENISDSTVEEILKGRIQSLKKKILPTLNAPSGQDLKALLDSLTSCLEISYNMINKKIIRPAFFENLDLGNQKSFDHYNLTKLRYSMLLPSKAEDSLRWVKKTYEDLVNLYNHGHKSFFINYNVLHIIQSHGKKINVQIKDTETDQYISELQEFATDSAKKELMKRLGLNFWFEICRQPKQSLSKDKIPLFTKSLQNIYGYFNDKKLSVKESVKLANYYLYHARADWAYELLWPLYENGEIDPDGLKILAHMLYENYEESGRTAYYEFLQNMYPKLGKKNWCAMFIGPCNISFQALDYGIFRDFYCEQCHDYMNYVKSETAK